jgi:hypothetical protein
VNKLWKSFYFLSVENVRKSCAGFAAPPFRRRGYDSIALGQKPAVETTALQ